MSFVTSVVVSAIAIWLTTLISGSVHLAYGGSIIGLIITALVVGLLLTLVNALFKPVVKLLSLPLYLLTLGLFSFVVNALCLWLVSTLSTSLLGGNGLVITGGIGSYIWVSILLSLVQVVIGWFAPKRNRRAPARRY